MENEIHFTPRELEVLEHISKGFQRKTIAAMLGIDIDTVDVHIGHIHKKTKTQGWGQLVVWAKDYFEK